jgi:transposase, IS5 family
LMVGARSFPGNPYDGHTLAAQLEQTTNLMQDMGRKPKEVIVDLGFRGVDADNPGVEIIHRGKYKSLTQQQRKWLKRRQAIEPLIGHTKADHGMQRCWLKGSTGDALHAISCAAGYNIRWLLRAIARLGLGGSFYALLVLLSWGVTARRVLLARQALRLCRSALVGANERQLLNWRVGAAG